MATTASLRGHLEIMNAARPVQEWITHPDTSAPLRERLQLAQRAWAFAVDELALPDNASHRRYARLDRTSPWNVVAAGPYLLTPHRWCFPIIGCIGYRATSTSPAHGPRPRAWRPPDWRSACTAYPRIPRWATATGWEATRCCPPSSAGPRATSRRLLLHELAHQVAYAEAIPRSTNPTPRRWSGWHLFQKLML